MLYSTISLIIDIAILTFLIIEAALRLRPKKTFTYALLHHEDHDAEVAEWNAMAAKHGLNTDNDLGEHGPVLVPPGKQVIVLWRPTEELFSVAMQQSAGVPVLVYSPTAGDVGPAWWAAQGRDLQVLGSPPDLLRALRIEAMLQG